MADPRIDAVLARAGVRREAEMNGRQGGGGRPAREMRAKRADQIAPTRVSWLWPGWLPAGRLALLGGRPGDGKSGICIDLAARLTTASPMPDGYRPPKPLKVLLLSGEDDPSDTLVPRLIAAGANLGHVVIANGTVVDNETGIARPWILPGDVDVLGQLVREHDVDLAAIDPLGAFIATAVDTHRDAAVRSMLLPLSQMARKDHCTVIGVRHHRKGGATDARDAGTGSIAFTAAARIEWVVGRDPQVPTRRVLAIAKTNIGKEPPSLAYQLVDAENEWETVRVDWQGTSPLTANQLVGEPTSEEDRSELDEATEFLREALAGGPVGVKDLKRSAKEAEIAERTLRRAKERLQVKASKTSDGPWLWRLRDQGGQAQDEGGHATEHPPLGILGTLGHLPSTHTPNNGGFSRDSLFEGGQGGQGGQGAGAHFDGHLYHEADALGGELPPDDDELDPALDTYPEPVW